jgi:hypothetical protein
MTDEPKKFPRPTDHQRELLYDAVWDLRDYGEAWVPLQQDSEQWLYWLTRYEGFAEGEIELGHNNKWNFQIKLKD